MSIDILPKYRISISIDRKLQNNRWTTKNKLKIDKTWIYIANILVIPMYTPKFSKKE